MDASSVEQRMYRMATDFIAARYPAGWGGAAVIRTANDHFYTSVAPETANGGAQLCIEVGALCEAHKYNERVTHCLCVVRDDETAPFKVLTPCGICQERLRYWGTNVLVGISGARAGLHFAALGALQPHHWSSAYPAEDLEHFTP